MDPAQLDRLLVSESTHVEWKENAAKPDELLRTVAAFANDLTGGGEPGFLLLGVGKSGDMAPPYPLEALKELVRNLVQHRRYDATFAPGRIAWFNDRIEINNPGAPFGAASEGEFGEQSDYRNPTITQTLVALGYVQRLGRGVRAVRAQLERHGCPPLEARTNGFTTVVLRRRPPAARSAPSRIT